MEFKSTGVCCFVGHRQIEVSEELIDRLSSIIEDLVLVRNVDTFIFGSKSLFNSLCYEQVNKIKEKHPHINRVYARAEYKEISVDYRNYLLSLYETTYYPSKAVGKAAYVERNRDMIDKSEFCVFYYNENNKPINRKSGTKLALDYAIRKKKKVIVLP